MALVLNEEQVMLRDSAAGFLGEKASVTQLRALRDSDDALRFDPAVWREMVDMGWAGIAIPENYGGLGYGYTGLGIVLEQMGRHLSAAPLQSCVLLGATLINQLGGEAQKSAWLAAIAGGVIVAAMSTLPAAMPGKGTAEVIGISVIDID